MRIAVYCASSEASDPIYRDDARELGRRCAESGHEIVYGGGARGSMGALADGALAAGGRVHGVLPHFMKELEWAHGGLSQLELVDDMRARKHRMLEGSDAVVALPGGCGTFEELFEVLTLKRLGIVRVPIVLLDTQGFWAPMDALLRHSVAERFMQDRHLEMWSVVATPAAVLPEIEGTEPWPENAIQFAGR
jgi:uncharacterized protein (TIGR00730 family)